MFSEGFIGGLLGFCMGILEVYSWFWGLAFMFFSVRAWSLSLSWAQRLSSEDLAP